MGGTIESIEYLSNKVVTIRVHTYWYCCGKPLRRDYRFCLVSNPVGKRNKLLLSSRSPGLMQSSNIVSVLDAFRALGNFKGALAELCGVTKDLHKFRNEVFKNSTQYCLRGKFYWTIPMQESSMHVLKTFKNRLGDRKPKSFSSTMKENSFFP